MAVNQSHHHPGAVNQCIYLSPGDGLNKAWLAQMIAASSLREKGRLRKLTMELMKEINPYPAEFIWEIMKIIFAFLLSFLESAMA